MNRSNAFRVIAFAAVTAIYVAVRFWDLSATCLWFDEIFSVHAAEHSWNSILDFVALDLIHPPLFYILLKVWIAIGGESLHWLRSLPVLFSIIAIIPFWLLCQELRLGFWTALLAFVLIAVNGSLIKYAQEVRMYSMLMCVSLFSIWLFARCLRVGRGIVLLAFVNLVLVHTHYFGWFVILSEIVATIIFQRAKWRPIVISAGVTLLGFAPWMCAVLGAANSGSELAQNLGWMQRPGPITLLYFLLDLITPFYFQQSSSDARSNFIISVPLMIGLAVAAAFLIRSKGNERYHSLSMLAAFTAVPTFFALLLSWISPFSIWGARHLVIMFVPFLIVAAICVDSIKIRLVKYGLLVVSFLLIGAAFTMKVVSIEPKPVWCACEDLNSKVPTDQPQTIYVFEDLVAYHLWFANRENPEIQIVKVDEFPEMIEDRSYFLPRGFFGVRRTDITGIDGDRFWVEFRGDRLNNRPLSIVDFISSYEVTNQYIDRTSGTTVFLTELRKK